jgi:hypothetical protein
MVTRVALLALLLLAFPRTATAQASAPAPLASAPAPLAPAPAAATPRPLPASPALHHVPLTVTAEHVPVDVAASIDRPDLVARAVLVYRHGGRLEEVLFERSSLPERPYVAVIPAEHVDRPGIEYAIEIVRTDGQRDAVFASRDQMQPVEVVGDAVDAREEALLARLHGRRFVVEAGGEYAYFGTATAQVCPGPCAAPGAQQQLVSQNVADQFWHVEANFTYRLLRTVSEFGIRGGVYRGTSVVPNVTDASQYNVGLNYGAPWVRLRATDWLHVEGEFLTSITEVGFSLGAGGAVLLGDPYGSYLTLGFESIEVFGSCGYSRFDVVANRWLSFAPTVEVTSMPHASSAGVRLLMDVGLNLGQGWRLTARGGYQARAFDSGGPAAGGGISYSF